MKEFFTYLYCMLTGRNTVFFCELNLKDNWEFFKQRISNYKPRDNKDEVYVSTTEDTINIDEYYDSGIRYKGSSNVINNQSYTEIKKELNKIHIKIEIERAFESKIVTNLFTFLNLLFVLLSITGTYYYIREGSNSNFNLGLIYLMQIIFLVVLILIWQMSRQRHLVIIKDIEKMTNDTNPATNTNCAKVGL